MLTRKEKKNAIWNSASFIVSSFFNFLNYSILFKIFDLNVFGFYIFLGSIFGLGGTLDFGFGISTIKNLAEARKQNDYKFLNSYFNTFLIVFSGIGILMAVMLTLYCIFFLKDSSILNNPSVRILDFNFIIFLMVMTFIFNYLNNYLRCTLEGFSEYVLLSQLNIFSVILNTILVLIILIFQLDIYILISFTLLVSLVTFSLTYIFIFFKKKMVVLQIKYFDFSLVRKYSLYGINIQLSSFVGGLVDVMIKYLIGLNLSLAFVSYFESGKKIINFSNGLIQSTQRGLLVKLSEENTIGKLKEFVNNSLYYYSKMSNYYSILFYGVLNPAICYFIILWFKSYDALIIYLIFSVSYSLINFGGSLYSVLMIEGKGMKLFIIQFTNLVLTFSLLYLTLNIFNNTLGFFGFYVSTIISLIVIFYSLLGTQGLSFKNYLRRIEFREIIKLNLLIILQIFFLIKYPDKMVYVLIISQIGYTLVFRNQLRFFIKLVYQKIEFMFKNKKIGFTE